MAKKGALDAGPEDDKEDVGEDTIFAGAEHDDDDELDNLDRGDDPTAEQVAAAEEEAEDEVEEPAVEAKSEDEAEDGETDESPELEASDEESDEESEEEVDDKQVSNYVSKDRFNAVNERMKLAEEALRERERELEAEAPAAAPSFDFDAKEVEYMELVTDGEFEKAKTIRQEIRAAERAELEAEVAASSTNATARVGEQIAFTNKIEELNEEFDHFNPQNEAYDQVLVDEAVDRRDLFIARGMSMADALDKAAREVAKLYDLPSNFEAQADAELARMEGEDKAKAPAARKVDVKKKVAQAAKQPPVMGEGSAQEEQKSATSMTDAEFEALPESTKARMRGDII